MPLKFNFLTYLGNIARMLGLNKNIINLSSKELKNIKVQS
jgi:hypothetical protein